MEDEDHRTEVDEAEQQLQLRRPRLQPGVEEKLALQFLDSMHNYLTLFDALSSTLRQVQRPIPTFSYDSAMVLGCLEIYLYGFYTRFSFK